MWLEDFTPSESGDSWPKVAENSEKLKEAIKRWRAWLKRVWKDEKKAKKHDYLLSAFLIEIIKNKKYDIILNDLFKALESSGNTSNFILWVLSLIYLPISNKIRDLNNVNHIIFNMKPYIESIDFDDNHLEDSFKNRINNWLEDINYFLWYEYSSIQIINFLEVIKNKNDDKYHYIILFISKVFTFFFKEFNVNISESKSHSYREFIFEEIIKSIKKIEIEKI